MVLGFTNLTDFQILSQLMQRFYRVDDKTL